MRLTMAAGPLRPDRFRLDAVEPAYLVLHRDGRLADRAASARRVLESCRLCPRGCDARRLEGRVGTCGVGRNAMVSSAFPHLGEEDCLRGRRGSGTVFFAGCGLRCAFCQNADVSWLRRGEEHDAQDLASIFLWLQAQGCHNLNLVTPSHVVPQFLEALGLAAGRGLRLPVVYNSSGYDTVETLRLLDGVVDVYMPDFKFWRAETAECYAAAPDYPERARAALVEMHRQTGPLLLGADGLARRGVLLRHLVMPGLVEESAAILGWLAAEVSRDTYVNIMGQYRPEWRVGEPDGTGGARFEEVNRRPRSWEMDSVYEAARRAGLWRFDARRGASAAASGS
jgi:putative pyruvate formate lyase activating enzyme